VMHSGGAHSLLDIALVLMALTVVVSAFSLAVRYTFDPGEESSDHIKRTVLDDRKREVR